MHLLKPSGYYSFAIAEESILLLNLLNKSIADYFLSLMYPMPVGNVLIGGAWVHLRWSNVSNVLEFVLIRNIVSIRLTPILIFLKQYFKIKC